jgi:hypothetical protein
MCNDLSRLGPRPELKRDRSNARAILEWERARAALDRPNKQIPMRRKPTTT